MDLGSLVYESTNIRPNFRKQTVSKIVVIKNVISTTCTPKLISLTENDQTLHSEVPNAQ